MRARRTSGFSLLEILVAFSILAVTLAAVHQAFGSGLSQERIAGRRSQDLLEARSLFDRLGRDVELVEGRTSGTFGTGSGWEMTLTTLDLPMAEFAAEGRSGSIEAVYVLLEVTAPDGRTIELRSVRPRRIP